jgi:hypothetical protein
MLQCICLYNATKGAAVTIPAQLVHKAQDALARAKTMDRAQLMRLLACSLRTLQRRLRDWGCLTSYNGNGQYYALPHVVQFDPYGIWDHDGRCFSRFGNLKKTVAAVIDETPQGITARELTTRLHVNAHRFLSQFADQKIFTRERLGGSYRYFSSDPQRATLQRNRYHASLAQEIRLSPLPDSVAVPLLLAWIDAPETDPMKLTEQLRQHHLEVTVDAVNLFLHQHHLHGKKKRN